MYRYKRGINSLDKAKQIEYSFSDNARACFSMSGLLEFRKPYNGMYIKNGKVMLAQLVEKIEVKDKVYKMTELTTSVQNVSCEEYITGIDLEKNIFSYNVGDISYTKKIAFDNKTDILCIEYVIKNNDRTTARFKVIPIITYRDFHNMKNSSMLKFNQRKIEDGTVISLSILNQENIILKSKEMTWKKEPQNLTNVKHEYINEDLTKEIYTEDLVLCGEFEAIVKGLDTKVIRLYISSSEIDINKISAEDIFYENERKNEQEVLGIDENFVELKELAKSISNLDMHELLIPYLPYRKDYDEILDAKKRKENMKVLKRDLCDLTDIVRSIEGQYISFGKYMEAKNTLNKIYKYIKAYEEFDIKQIDEYKKYVLLKLWYIESVNRMLQKENKIDLYLDSVKEIIYSLITKEAKESLLDEIEIVALLYNAIKIYVNMLNWIGYEDPNMEAEENYLHDLIVNKFWCEDKRIMKKNLNDTDPCANIEMIYTLSLSYPCIVDTMPIKLLDTIFKELYTPYGLRVVSKNSKQNSGLIYPKYMAHFVKANLSQNGVTRASQKIAYNLVKELLQDVGKYVNGGIKKVYNEKGINVDSIAYDLLTNAEMIRLYNMLT